MHCNEKELGKDIKLYYTDFFLYKYLLEAFFDLGTEKAETLLSACFRKDMNFIIAFSSWLSGTVGWTGMCKYWHES